MLLWFKYERLFIKYDYKNNELPKKNNTSSLFYKSNGSKKDNDGMVSDECSFYESKL